MSTPLRRKRVMAAKIETTIGTAIALTATEGLFNAFNAVINPTATDESREGQGSFDPIQSVVGARMGQITFTTELAPGSGALPYWATCLLPACGLVASGSVYTPRTEAPGSNVKTITIGVYEEGKFKSLRGAMGTAVFRFVASMKVNIDWTFTGIWVPPTDSAIIAPDYPGILPLRFAGSGLTLEGDESSAYTPKLQELTIDLGNEVVMREDSSDSSGYSSALIVGRRINGTMNPEQELVADKDWYGEWLASTENALDFSLTDADGLGVAFSVPALQFLQPQEGERNQIAMEQIPWQANRAADAGDDSLSITFDNTPT